MSAQGVETHVSSRIDSLRQHANQHVTETMDGVKKVISGQGVNDLLALKPVQAVADVAKNVVDGVFGDIIMGNIDVAVDSVKSQASITRQSRG